VIRREGDRLVVAGSVLIANVLQWREQGLREIDRDGMVVDLGGLEEADSSAISLLFEWQREARARGFALRFANLPENLRSLAEVYGVLDLIPQA